MAEGDGTIYNNAKEQFFLKVFDFVNDTFKLMLVNNGHSLDIDGDSTYADVSGDEEAGDGYTAGGETVTSKSVTQDNSNDRAAFDFDNVTWNSLDVGTPGYAILYDDTASDYLVVAWELGRASNGGDYTVQIHSDGAILLT